jgi:hypothetical protein
MEKMVGRVIGMNRSWISTHVCPSRFEINISAERWEPRDEGERNVKRETHYKVEVSAEMAAEIRVGQVLTVEVRPSTPEEEIELIQQEHRPENTIE